LTITLPNGKIPNPRAKYFRKSFWRNYIHHEVDLHIEEGTQLKAVEIKSGKTFQPDFFFTGLQHFEKIAPEAQKILVHGGDEL
jgi:uncharacterized protein